MAFEMKGSTFYGKSPLAKNDTTKVKTDSKGYTDKDKKFLDEQREERVMRSDFDEGSIQQKMFDCNQNPKTRWDNKLKKCVKK